MLWRIIWGPRLRGSRRNGLLYGLLNCHATRRPRSGPLPLLASTNEPGDEESDEESDKRPHSNSHDIPPAPPYVSPSSPHGAIPSSIVVNESRVALLRRRRLLSCRVNRSLPEGEYADHSADGDQQFPPSQTLVKVFQPNLHLSLLSL